MQAEPRDDEELKSARLLPALSATAAVAAAFCFVVAVLLLANAVQLRLSDPLNDPALVDLRRRYAADGENEQIMQSIRALDLLARKAFFTSRAQVRRGSYLLLGGTALLLLLLGAMDRLRVKAPDPRAFPGPETVWDRARRQRRALTAGGAGLIAAALAAAALSRNELKEAARIEPPAAHPLPSPTGNGTERDAAAAGAEPGGTAEETLNRNSPLVCPGFRGADGGGNYGAAGVPAYWNEAQKSNVLWKAEVPLPGLGGPAVWNDRVFVAGATRERRELYCYDRADGRLLWTGTYASSPRATTEYSLYSELETVLHAAATPATDGRFVYAIFANGELVAFDAQTGRAAWSAVLGDTANNAYGLSSSPLAYDGSVTVVFDGAESVIARFDGATGAETWRRERGDVTWASPVLARTAGGRDLVISHGNPETAAWDAAGGDKVWAADLVSGETAPTPVCRDGRLYACLAYSGIFAVNLADGARLWTVDGLEESRISDAQSMVTDGELLYHFCGDVLSVLDAATGAQVYARTMDREASYASPFIADDRLYLVCGDTVLVAATGREFVPLAACALNERCDANPAVAGGRIYLRGDKSLYCIGAAE